MHLSRSQNLLFALAASVLAVATIILPALPTHAALQAVGPLNTTYGFPSWYQDTNGLALQLCLGTNPDGTGPADPNCVLPTVGPLEPNFPAPFIVGAPDESFPSEAFWYIAEAIRLGIGNGTGNLKFRYALESAFAVDPPTVGQQIAFLRINLAPMAGLVPGATYTVTHPFGQFTTEPADGTGVVPLTRFEDGAFSPPLTSATAASFLSAPFTQFGPFLKQVTPAPPAGYIGDALNESAIESGPNGNFLRIDGPSIDLGNIDGDGNPDSLTIDTWIVAGKIAVIDTVAPTITPTPLTVTSGSTNVVASVDVNDDQFVGRVTIDLGPLGNTLSATLSGAQEVPATASGAAGSGTFTIDTAANTLSFDISHSGLVGGAETAAHIHGPAAAGANALPVFDLPLGASKTGVWNYPEALEADILAGRTYVNVHTTLFPNGEIRGQILPQANVQNMVLTAGTITNGTWGVVIPSVNRLGTFSLPVVVSDGSNVTTATLTLNVVELTSVSVSPAASSVVIGATQQLTASPFDQNGNPFAGATVTFTSSDPAVATVDGTGLVTGVSVGSATVTASATSGAITVSGTATVTVVPEPPVLSSVSVSPTVARISIGGTRQFTASPLDQSSLPFAGSTVSWTSSNPAIASVNASGLVTGVSVGTTTISATATSGALSFAASSAITVVDGPACQTDADTDADGAISNAEILPYIGQWKLGSVTNVLILQAIGFWKTGTGC